MQKKLSLRRARQAIALVASLGCFVAPGTGHAGCPALPAEAAEVVVQTCRFYDAAQDAAFVVAVERHFHDGWDGESAAALRRRREQALERNTGVLLTVRHVASAEVETLFFRTGDADACPRVPRRARVMLQRRCAMVFFSAPTDRVVVAWNESAATH